MNLNDIINEEFDALIAELAEASGGGVGIEPFNYRKTSSDGSRWEIDVIVPERKDSEGNTTPTKQVIFEVTFGNGERNGETVVSIAFAQKGGSHSTKTGFGVQFKLLATITKIVKEVAAIRNPDIFRFSPVKETDVDPSKGNRRMMLYLRYVESGAGEDYDGFILGDDLSVSVEKKVPSFPIRNGYQPKEDIQAVLTQLSKYHGRYESVLPRNDPDYVEYRMSDYGEMYELSSQGRKSTYSARRFYDWMLDDPTIRYVDGDNDPNRNAEPDNYSRPEPAANEPVDAPIQRITDPMARHGNAVVGTFEHFMQNDVYGNPRYQALEPFYNNIKDIATYEALKASTERELWNATEADRPRLQGIIDAVNKLRAAYDRYNRSNSVNETLNSIVNNLNELLG